MTTARDEAAKGKAAFRDWWNLESTKEQWSILRGYLAEFQRIAEQAEEVERRKNAVREDPFTGHVDDRTPEQRVAEYEAACEAAEDVATVDALVTDSGDWVRGIGSDLNLRVELATANARDRIREAANG